MRGQRVNGDEIIEEKIKANQNRKKVSTLEFSNLLDNLEIIDENLWNNINK